MPVAGGLDLVTVLVDTQPTGQLVVFGADPNNTVLDEKYNEIIAEFEVPDPQKVPEAILERVQAVTPETLVQAPFSVLRWCGRATSASRAPVAGSRCARRSTRSPSAAEPRAARALVSGGGGPVPQKRTGPPPPYLSWAGNALARASGRPARGSGPPPVAQRNSVPLSHPWEASLASSSRRRPSG
ncbi:hypothetical protein SALBM311S_12550 [Streptomyces alboniger]